MSGKTREDGLSWVGVTLRNMTQDDASRVYIEKAESINNIFQEDGEVDNNEEEEKEDDKR